jgi:uncharacterized protein (TIGR00299 family) protein
MPIALVDCFSGAAGDMWVGALLDLGLPLGDLAGPVASLGLEGVAVRSERVVRGSLAGTLFVVDTAARPPVLDPGVVVVPRRAAAPAAHHGQHRGLAEIEAILARADVAARVRERCRAVFHCIAEAEAKVHGTTVAQVHFHEVGAEDTIVDVVCAVLGTDLLGIERIHSSEVVVGKGTVRCEHGTLPVPAPGTLEILKGIPIRAGELSGERTTPTGAALLKVLVHDFARPVRCVPERTGYGAGTRDTEDVPNLLRITLAESFDPGAAPRIVEISCNLDTASGELLAFLIDGCLQRGAADAFAVPATAKKGRPAFVLHALCDHAAKDGVATFLLEESSTLGVRMHEPERRVLERWSEMRETALGPVRMKCARLPSGAVVARPEDDEVSRLVRESGLARREVLLRIGANLGA